MKNEVNKRKNKRPAEERAEKHKYHPLTDIYESDEAIYLTANMPGVDEKSVDITLEKNILTIKGHAADQAPENMELYYSEYAVGDYERSFVLSDEINFDNISAKVKDGVLNIVLPKDKKSRIHRIPVNAA